jgi:hypothetical protein
MMGQGVPTIISDIEPLAEFPEGSCLKISPDEWEEDTLLASFELLAEEPELRQQLGDNGRRYLERYHNAAWIARQYLVFIEQVVAAEEKP